MSTQIAVRLPDAIVAFLDDVVASGAVPSRAALVTESLEREIRRRAALQDVMLLQRHGNTDADLDPLTEWGAGNAPMDLE